MKRLNQILSVDNSKKEKVKNNNMRTRGPIEIQTILKFFAVSILIFGVFMIGSGSYSMYKESSKEASNKKPVISVEQTSETEILLKVTHDKALSELTYSWNDEESTQVSCNGKKEIETKIEIPAGINTLTVYATDVNGQKSEYKKGYSVEEDINIRVEKEEKNNVKITANGKSQLSYMTYRWDEEDETRVEINSDQIEQVIEVPKGLHTLTVIVVDVNNATQTKEQEVIGVSKPKLDVTTDGTNFLIKASDEQGITKVEFVINETEKYRLDLTKEYESVEDRKEFEYSYPLHDGENKLEVTVYNESDVTETFKAKFNK